MSILMTDLSRYIFDTNKNFLIEITVTVIVFPVRVRSFINSTYVLPVYPKIIHLVEFTGHRYAGLSYIRGSQCCHFRQYFHCLRLVSAFLIILLLGCVNNNAGIITRFA